MIFVIDASVAIKWFVNESGWEPAREWLDSPHTLVAPDFLRIELANIVWKKQQRREMSPQQASEVMATLDDQFDWFEVSKAHLPAALRLAGDLSHPVYDCIYLAAADALGTSVVTADQRLLGVCQRHELEHLVRPAADVPGDVARTDIEPVQASLPDVERLGLLINDIFAGWPAGASGGLGKWSEIDDYVTGSPAYRQLSSLTESLSDTDRLSFVLAIQFGIVPRQPLGRAQMNARAILAGPDFDLARYLARYVTVISGGIQTLIGVLAARPSAQ